MLMHQRALWLRDASSHSEACQQGFPKPVVLVQLPEFQKDPSIKDPNPAKLTLASDLKIQVLCFLSAT